MTIQTFPKTQKLSFSWTVLLKISDKIKTKAGKTIAIIYLYYMIHTCLYVSTISLSWFNTYVSLCWRVPPFCKGKSAHFCPTPSLVPASFGGHSKFFFPSRMTPNDPRMRNEVWMTGTKKGMTWCLGSFDPPSTPFGPPLTNTEGRSGLVPVIPSNEDHVSFRLILKYNDLATRDIFVLGSFHHKSCVRSWIAKWHQNDNGMTSEWKVYIGTTLQWCNINDFGLG